MSFFDAMILGIVQGLTEFLPVSSSGHLVILENLLNIRTDTDVLFHVLLHFGTLIAICLVFKNDLFRMLVETIHIFQDLTANFKIYIDNKMHSAQTTPYRKILCNNYRTMVAMILISTIPTGILGYLLQNLVDRWSSSLPVTGLGLLITAVLLLVVDNWQLGNKLPKHITVPQALAIGVCQGISVIPGISLSYSKPDSFTHYNTPTVSYVPFVMIGKYHEVDGRVKIPITTEFHHAVNDGYHAEQFFHLLEDCCREF